MKDKVLLSQDDLREHLADQLLFLEGSGEAYDRGLVGEAKRLAVSLRVLCHDSRNSHSLLGQLERLSGSFLSTAAPNLPGNLASHAGLVMIGMKGRETKYLAMLDDVPLAKGLVRKYDELGEHEVE